MEHERDLEAEQRIRIMISQIQPHFLYNTISTIRVLCKRDPERAAEVSEKFGQYLRQNLDSLNSDNMIPFTKELEHTMTYTDIEMVRFDNIRVDYDIQASDFTVPALTLQPMVENAIRHGIRIREEGIVLVSTRRSGNYYEINIKDNGTGFNAAEIDAADQTHIGIRNVRERIEKLAKGTFEIESRIGVGTTVTIRIPANDGKMTEDNRR
jgi:sensor histidine kinase YesM